MHITKTMENKAIHLFQAWLPSVESQNNKLEPKTYMDRKTTTKNKVLIPCASRVLQKLDITLEEGSEEKETPPNNVTQ